MTNHPIVLVTVVAAAAVIETMLDPKPAPRFVLNVSESVPTGLYQVQPARDLIVTTLVVAYPPQPLATLLDEGGYLPREVPTMQRVMS
jgi:type IV secretory pathway protease TraF